MRQPDVLRDNPALFFKTMTRWRKSSAKGTPWKNF
jgi:hypothetical protein